MINTILINEKENVFVVVVRSKKILSIVDIKASRAIF